MQSIPQEAEYARRAGIEVEKIELEMSLSGPMCVLLSSSASKRQRLLHLRVAERQKRFT